MSTDEKWRQEFIPTQRPSKRTVCLLQLNQPLEKPTNPTFFFSQKEKKNHSSYN